MRQFFVFVKKETWHILRDTRTTVILLVIPVVLLLLLGYAISTETKDTPFVVFDQAHNTFSQQLKDKISANAFFHYKGDIHSAGEIEQTFKANKAKVAIVFPNHFEQDLYKSGKTDIQVIIDASDPAEATNLTNYLQSILFDFQQSISKSDQAGTLIDAEIKLQYNPQAISVYSFVPGVMGCVLLLICAMMTSIAIVREKELGTMEILLVSPVKPLTIILSKSIPYFVISMFNAISILLISYFLLDVPINGNLGLIFLLCIIFTFTSLLLGLLISAVTNTQELAVIASLLGLMLPSIILTGMIFPLESAPRFLQLIADLVPAKWFIEAMRDVMIKGLGITAVLKPVGIMLLMAISLLFASVKLFKERL